MNLKGFPDISEIAERRNFSNAEADKPGENREFLLFRRVQGAMRYAPDFVETCKSVLNAVMGPKLMFMLSFAHVSGQVLLALLSAVLGGAQGLDIADLLRADHPQELPALGNGQGLQPGSSHDLVRSGQSVRWR